MILAFITPLILLAILLSTRRRLLRKHWYMLFSLGFVITFFVSFVSVWSAWNPYALSGSLQWGNNSGASALSFPLQMNVYVAPPTEQGELMVSNVSFDVLVPKEKLLETNGTLSYDLFTALFGRSGPVSYQLGSPFFSNTVGFFGFLLFLFLMFNLAGFTMGMILSYGCLKNLQQRSTMHKTTDSPISPSA